MLLDEAAIYLVEVSPSLQRQWIFTEFINQLYNDKNIKKIQVLAVSTYSMINCSKKIFFDGFPFFDHGWDFMYSKDLNYCKCHKIIKNDNSIHF